MQLAEASSLMRRVTWLAWIRCCRSFLSAADRLTVIVVTVVGIVQIKKPALTLSKLVSCCVLVKTKVDHVQVEHNDGPENSIWL